MIHRAQWHAVEHVDEHHALLVAHQDCLLVLDILLQLRKQVGRAQCFLVFLLELVELFFDLGCAHVAAFDPRQARDMNQTHELEDEGEDGSDHDQQAAARDPLTLALDTGHALLQTSSQVNHFFFYSKPALQFLYRQLSLIHI